MQIFATGTIRAQLPAKPLEQLTKALELIGSADRSSLNVEEPERYHTIGQDLLIIDGMRRTGGVAISLVNEGGTRFRAIVRVDGQKGGMLFYQKLYDAVKAVSIEDSNVPRNIKLQKVNAHIEQRQPSNKHSAIVRPRLFRKLKRPGRQLLSPEERSRRQGERRARHEAVKQKRRESKKAIGGIKSCLATIENNKVLLQGLLDYIKEKELDVPHELIASAQKHFNKAP